MEVDVRTVIQQLLDTTQSVDPQQLENLSLLSGLPGHLLFHWYAAKTTYLMLDDNIFLMQMAYLTEQAPLLGKDISLGYGVAGFGWLMELLLTERSDGYDPDFNQDIEDYLTLELQKNISWSGEIELVLGLSGIAVFAARRLRNNRGLELYSAIVKIFAGLAVYEASDVCTWPVPAQSVYRFDKQNPERDEYNLGLAHGVPAVIGALIPAIKHPEVGQQAAELVSYGCNWLIKQAFSGSETISLFSNCSGLERSSRLAWCYGDLSIALILARSGQALARQDLLDYACEIGMHAAKRAVGSAMVHDAGLCHGSAGLMLIFQLLHQIIPMPEFVLAADYWFENTLARYKEHGLKGFYAFETGQSVEKTGFLEGFSGVGLCLLAQQGITPDWADVLLLA